MRIFLAGVFLIISTGAAAAEDWPPATDLLFNRGDCSQAADRESCKYSVWAWTDTYKQAIAGRYQSQSTLALLLAPSKHGDWVRPNAVLACAWRTVIIEYGHLEADAVDISNKRVFCGENFLDDNGRQLAEAQAKAILKLMGR